MNKFLDSLYERASKQNKTIALAEGFDKRAVKAAELLTKRGIAKVVLIGDADEIAKNNPEIDLTGVKIVNPKTCEKTKEYANLLYELRKAKGMTEEQAYELTVNNEMFYGCLMLKSGDVDGLVGGATFSSADVLRSAFQVIKPAPGIKSVSSCFVIVPPEGNTVTDAPAMIFSDCAVIPEPDENQLADVAVAAADSARNIVGI